MSALDAVTIDELCHTLGLRSPLGLRVDAASERTASVTPLDDEQLTALRVLAQPEAIAVVTHYALDAMFVIATRGAWVAEHVIEGTRHHLYARDAGNAPTLLLERTGYSHTQPVLAAPIDITVGGYRRMTELLQACDRRRAEAALLAEGAAPSSADALIAAELAGRVEVTGLALDGHRYVGCDLSIVGDATTGHWHVPSAASASPNQRVRIEPVDPDDLVDDLALIFGDDRPAMWRFHEP